MTEVAIADIEAMFDGVAKAGAAADADHDRVCGAGLKILAGWTDYFAKLATVADRHGIEVSTIEERDGNDFRFKGLYPLGTQDLFGISKQLKVKPCSYCLRQKA